MAYTLETRKELKSQISKYNKKERHCTGSSKIHGVVDDLRSVDDVDDLVVVPQLLDEEAPVVVVVVDSVVARLLQVEDDPLVLRGQ